MESNLEHQGDHDNLPFGFEDSDDEKEDYKIHKDDNLFVAGKIEEEFAALEVYVYERSTGNLFVHHDIMLSSFPLCVEWLPIEPSTLEGNQAEKANYAIVGTFYPDIEIWNLDQLDAIEPTMILAGEDANTLGKLKKKKGKKASNDVAQGHKDSITSMQLNSFRKNLLVTGSADCTVKVWDLQESKPAWSVKPDNNKRVEIVKWHPQKESMVLTVSENKMVSLWDVRQGDKVGSIRLDKQCEGIAWDQFGEERLWLAFEDGSIGEICAAKGLELSFDMKISGKSITSLSANSHVNGMLSTTSLDGIVRLFDVNTRDADNHPTKTYEK